MSWCRRSGRETFAAFMVLTGLIVATGRLTVGCAELTPTAKAQIAKDQVELGLCAAEAHMDKQPDGGSNFKAWATFDDCMTRKGFYDGGSDAR